MVDARWCFGLWLALVACKADESDGGTETDAGSTGSQFSAGPHGNVTQDEGGPSSFTTSPGDGADDGVDDGVDDGGDDRPGDSTGPGSDGGSGQESEGSGGSGSGSSTGAVDDGGDDGGSGGECCSEQDVGGCGGGPVERCVCAEDEFCCSTVWDVVCTVQVVTLGCGTCPGIGGEGDCCSPNGTPGCDDDEIEACVCNEDFVCCTQDWDQLCADTVESAMCGRCP